MSALQGCVVVVTGATGNVGWGAAQAFAAAGAHVVATVRGAAPEVEALLAGDAHLLVRGDLAVEGDAERVREAALTRFWRIDHVVASIGPWWQKGPVVEQDLAEFRAVLDSLLTSQFLVARAMLPWMRRHGGGSYTIVTGAGGEVAIPNAGLLGAAVMGVFGLSRALRAEHRGGGVRVNELRIRARIERAARAGVIPSAVAGEVFAALARADTDGAVVTYRQPDDASTLPLLRDAPGTA